MRPIHPELVKRIRRADPEARIIVEALEQVQEDGKDLQSEWNGADSQSGWISLARGGAMLQPALSDVVANTTNSGTYITDLDNSAPFECAEITFGAGNDVIANIETAVLRLVAQRNGGNPKTVDTWRVQLFRVARATKADEYELEPITDVADASAASGGTTPGDVTFTLTPANLEDNPVTPGGGPEWDEDETAADKDGRTRIVLILWALRNDGSPADNVGWDTDNAVGSKSSSVDATDLITRRTLTVTGSERILRRGRTRVFISGTPTGVPTLTLRGRDYTSSQTITFTTNPISLGASPDSANQLEIVAEGLTPDDSTLVFEIDDGVQGWTQVYDGDVIGEDNSSQGGADLSLFLEQTDYDARVTLNPNTDDTVSPIVHRFMVREINTTDLDSITVVQDPQWSVNVDTLKGEIGECIIEVLKDGEVDFRDWATDLIATRFINEFFFRIRIGHPDLDRQYWLHIDDFYPEKYIPGGPTLQFVCLNAFHFLRQDLPRFTGTTRQLLQYVNQTLKDASDDILTGQITGIPGRVIGPGIEDDTTTVSKDISDSDAKDELDALAHISGGGWITDRGRITFKTLHTRAPPLVVFDKREIAWDDVDPGLDRRIPQYFVKHSWLPEQNIYNGEVRSYHTDSINKLGTAFINTHQVADDIIQRWIDSAALANTVAARKVTFQGTGVMEWKFTSLYPHPELTPGDIVTVHTEKYVGRDPGSDTELRGEVQAIGVITAVHDLWHTEFTVWIRSFEDIISTEENVTLDRFGLNSIVVTAERALSAGEENNLPVWKREVTVATGPAVQSLNIAITYIQPRDLDSQPPASDTINYNYNVDVSPNTTLRHLLRDSGGVNDELYFIDEDEGVLLPGGGAAGFGITITPYNATGGSGGSGVAGPAITTQARHLFDYDDVGFRGFEQVDARVDANDPGSGSADLDMDNNANGFAFDFTPSVNMDLSQVRLYLKKTGTPTGNAVVRVYDDSAGLPGTVLGTSDNFDVATLGTSYGSFGSANMQLFDFSTTVSLTASTLYHIAVEYSGGTGTDYVSVQADTSGASDELNGSWAAGPSNLMKYRVYEETEIERMARYVNMSTNMALTQDGTGKLQMAASVGSTGLGALSDVTLTGESSGDFLRHDGTDWKNSTIQVGDLPSHTHVQADISDTPISVANGGTGLSTLTSTGRLVQSTGATSAMTTLDSGADGGFIRSDGTNWARVTGVPAADVVAGTFPSGVFAFTGQVSLADGSAGAPALRATSATTTGLFFSAGAINFSVTGTERAEITASALTTTVPVLTSDGSRTAPSHSFSGNTSLGLWNDGSDTLGIAADIVTIAHDSASGSPRLAFYQTTTERARLEYIDTNDELRLDTLLATGRISFRTNSVEYLRITGIDADEGQLRILNAQVWVEQQATYTTATPTIDWDLGNVARVDNDNSPTLTSINMGASTMQDGGTYICAVRYGTGGAGSVTVTGVDQWANDTAPSFGTDTVGDYTVIMAVKVSGTVLGLFWQAKQ